MWKQASTWLLLSLMVWSSSGQVVYAHYCRTKNSIQIGLGNSHSTLCAQQKGFVDCCSFSEVESQKTELCELSSRELGCCNSDRNTQESLTAKEFGKEPVWKKHCCDQVKNWWRPGLELPKPLKEVKQWIALGFLGQTPRALDFSIGKNYSHALSEHFSRIKDGAASTLRFLSLLQVYRI